MKNKLIIIAVFIAILGCALIVNLNAKGKFDRKIHVSNWHYGLAHEDSVKLGLGIDR